MGISKPRHIGVDVWRVKAKDSRVHEMWRVLLSITSDSNKYSEVIFTSALTIMRNVKPKSDQLKGQRTRF